MSITAIPAYSMISPLGKCTARLLWTDDEAGVRWIVSQDETGEIWWWFNEEVRFEKSISGETYGNSPIQVTPERAAMLEPHRERHTKAPARAAPTLVPAGWDTSPGAVNQTDVDNL